jgi:hypothetical protein
VKIAVVGSPTAFRRLMPAISADGIASVVISLTRPRVSRIEVLATGNFAKACNASERGSLGTGESLPPAPSLRLKDNVAARNSTGRRDPLRDRSTAPGSFAAEWDG